MLKTSALAVALLIAAPVAPAHATLQIAFSDGLGHIVTCADGAACDLAGPTGSLLLLDAVVGNFHVEGSFSTSTAGAPNNLEVSNLTIANDGLLAGGLEMIVSDTGYIAPVSRINESASLTFNSAVGSGPSSLSFFADVANGQGAGAGLVIPGALLFTNSGAPTIDPDSFSGSVTSPFLAGGPFSMTEVANLTLRGGATITGFNEAMQTAVPEPSTWAMLVAGFALIGAFVRRRRGGDRLASL
jgi:hypothetical protein